MADRSNKTNPALMTQVVGPAPQGITIRSDAERIVLRARYIERERLARRAMTRRPDDADYSSLFDHVPFGR